MTNKVNLLEKELSYKIRGIFIDIRADFEIKAYTLNI